MFIGARLLGGRLRLNFFTWHRITLPKVGVVELFEARMRVNKLLLNWLLLVQTVQR